MRRYVTIGGIVATVLFAGSVTAIAGPPAPDPVCAPAAPRPGPEPAGEPGPDPGSDPAEKPGQEPDDEPAADEPAADEPAPDEPADDDSEPVPGSAGPEPTAPDCSSGEDPGGAATSAATLLGWGEPDRVAEFTGALDDSWQVYDGPGYAGEGRRTPDALTVSDGILTITGDADGATGGMCWHPGQKYGRWEGRVRAPAGDESYTPLLLLWPTADDFPVGGEIDFMEMLDPTRRKTYAVLHHGPDNRQVAGEVEIDGTQWHDWAVEWTPDHVVAFVDGTQWWRITDTSILPPGPMHLCVQLDWFPGSGDVQESSMQVDWVKQYSLGDAAGTAAEGVPAPTPGRLTEGAPDVVGSRDGLVERAERAPGR